MQVGLACLKFAGEHIGRFDRDLPHPVLRPGSVSHEPYAEPGGGLPSSRSRTCTQHAAGRYRFPAPAHACAGAGLHALRHGAVRAQVRVIGTDPEAVAAGDAGKVPAWLPHR